MARGKWLSNEEKAEITRMRASGMTTSQIASHVQRGIKTIQRVLNGKYSSAPDTESPTRKRVPTNAEGGVSAVPAQLTPPTSDVIILASNQSLAPPVIATSNAVTKATDTLHTGQPEVALAIVSSGQRRVRNVNVSTHATKLPRQFASSPQGDLGVNVKIPVQPPRLHSHIQHTETNTSPNRAVRGSTDPSEKNQGNRLNALPSVVPVNQLQQQFDENLVRQMESMANLIPDDDSDDGMCESSRIQVSTPIASTCRIEAQEPRRRSDTVTVERDRRHAQLSSQVETHHFAAMESPLLSFESQLRSSQESSWASASQIEPEPATTKKRKFATGARERGKRDPVERALKEFNETLMSTMTTSKLGIYEERLTLLFQRFEADVRLVQLERKQSLAQLPNNTFSC